MNDITVRLYNPEDLEPCRALWTELTQHHRDIYNDPSIGGETPGLYFDAHLARVGPEHIWVAEQSGEIIGCTGLIVEGQEAELEPLVVTATRRGRGVGRALVNHAIQEARKLQVRYLSVRPVARNVDAISFFCDHGFGTVGHIELFMELGPSTPGAWKPGLKLFERAFEY